MLQKKLFVVVNVENLEGKKKKKPRKKQIKMTCSHVVS